MPKEPENLETPRASNPMQAVVGARPIEWRPLVDGLNLGFSGLWPVREGRKWSLWSDGQYGGDRATESEEPPGDMVDARPVRRGRQWFWEE